MAAEYVGNIHQFNRDTFDLILVIPANHPILQLFFGQLFFISCVSKVPVDIKLIKKDGILINNLKISNNADAQQKTDQEDNDTIDTMSIFYGLTLKDFLNFSIIEGLRD